MSKLLKWALLLIISMAISLGVGEGIARYFKPQLTYTGLMKIVGDYYSDSPFNRFTLKKNYDGIKLSSQEKDKLVRVSTNSLGLRSPEISMKKNGDTKRILILGDSHTFGLHVGNEESYPSVLQSKLNQFRDNIEVVNAGYANGHETDEQYCWLMNKGFLLEPDLIIYGLFLGNDIMRINEANWTKLDQWGLPNMIKDSTTYVSQSGVLRSRVESNGAMGVEWIYRIPILRNSHLALYLFHGIRNRFFKELVWKESAIGHSFAYVPHIFKKASEEFDEKERIFLKLVDGMNEGALKNNAKFLVVMHPFNFQVEPQRFLERAFPKEIFGTVAIQRDYYDELEDKLAARQIPYVNMLKEMKNTPGNYYPDNGEVHYNAEGHRFTAESIKKILVDLNLP